MWLEDVRSILDISFMYAFMYAPPTILRSLVLCRSHLFLFLFRLFE